MKIAIQGAIGSFHHEAAGCFAPGAAEPVVCRTFRAVCVAVRTGAAARGLMAVENSLAGGIVAGHLRCREDRGELGFGRQERHDARDDLVGLIGRQAELAPDLFGEIHLGFL